MLPNLAYIDECYCLGRAHPTPILACPCRTVASILHSPWREIGTTVCQQRRTTSHGRAVPTVRRILDWLSPYRADAAAALGLTGLACLMNLPVPLLVQG